MAKRVFKRNDGSSVITRESLKSYYILKYFNLFMNGYKFTGLDYQQKDFLLRKMWAMGREEHQKFKAKMYKQSEDTIKNMDAVLVLNMDKEKDGVIYKNYIGGATFLEMYDAFRMNKKIYLYNDIPQSILTDEIKGFAPILINGDLNLVK